jgi:flagellin
MGADLTRIAANIPAMQNISTLQSISDKIATHQLRLSTGKRINSAGEDPAGYMLARGLESRRRGLSQALDNVSNAQNVLNVAEGGYGNIMDILQTVKEKAVQAADGSLSSTQRGAINDQVSALLSEIDEITSSVTFNGSALIDGSFSATNFQTGEQSGETLAVALDSADSATIGVNAIDLSTAASANAAMATIDTAIDNLSTSMKEVGEYKAQLSARQTTLESSITNTEAVRSTIEDADFAKEQMEVMKLQILQQTALSSLTQSNSQPQIVLSLFG